MLERPVGLLLGDEADLGEDDRLDAEVGAQLLEGVEGLAVTPLLLHPQEVLHHLPVIFGRRVVLPPRELGDEGEWVLGDLRRLDRREDAGDLDLLQYPQRRPLAQPRREDLSSVRVTRGLSPSLEYIRVRAVSSWSCRGMKNLKPMLSYCLKMVMWKPLDGSSLS